MRPARTRAMNAAHALLGAAVALTLASCTGASAAPSGPLSLDASGYAAVGGEIRAVSVDLAFSARADGTFLSAGGTLTVNTETIRPLGADGAFTRDSRIVELSGSAGPPAGPPPALAGKPPDTRGGPVSMDLSGRLADGRADTSVYVLTGTLERGGTAGRAALAAILSPLLAERASQAVAVPAPPTLETDGAHTVVGAGYAVVGENVEPITLSMELAADGDSFSSADGALGIGSYELGTLDIDGAFSRNERIVDVSGTAGGRGEPVDVKLLGRLVDRAADEHGERLAYVLTGTLERGGVAGKAVIAALASVPARAETRAQDDAILVTLSAEPRQPGAPPGHFDEPILRVRPGQNVTIANADAESHRLVSGAINDWFYERASAAPRTCSPDGTPDEGSGAAGSQRRSSEAIARDRCDFSRDARIDVTVGPGDSTTIRLVDRGIYRIIDPASPWIQLTVVSVDSPARCPPHCQQ